MHWETGGGGQISFTITRSEQAYDVLVTSYGFEARQDRFTITAESGPVYEAISRAMQYQGSIRSYTSDAPRGSWTTLEFSDGSHLGIYEDAVIYPALGIIYDYVAAQLE